MRRCSISTSSIRPAGAAGVSAKPRRKGTAALRLLPAGGERVEGPQAIPGPADLLMHLNALWLEHDRMENLVSEHLKDENPTTRKTYALAAKAAEDRAKAVEALILSAAPRSLPDAAAQLAVLHHDIRGRCLGHRDPELVAVADMLSHSMHALTLIARQSGFDLARYGRDYMLMEELAIARGEVPA